MTIKYNSKILVDKYKIIIPTHRFIFLSILFILSCYIILNAMSIHNYIYYNNEFKQIEQEINISDYNVYEFSSYLDNNYNYTSYYDCKFFAYVWKKYADYNNNLNAKYIYPSDYHLMTSLNNKSKICLTNLYEVNCYS